MDSHAGDPRAQLRACSNTVGRPHDRAGYRGCPFTNAATEFPDPDHPGREVAEENKRELRRVCASCRGDSARATTRVWPISSSC